MKRSIQRVVVLACAAIALCLGGCEVRSLRICIPDFESNRVGGVWVYQLSERSGEFERMAQLVFTESFDKRGAEVLTYSIDGLVDAKGDKIHVEVEVARNPENSDEVTMDLLFPCDPPSAIKVSTYNAIGESPLSDETLYL